MVLPYNLVSNPILPVYYLYGSETYLIDEAVRVLKERVLSPGLKDLNCQTLYVKETDVPTIIFAAQTLPLMAQKRLVLVKEAEALTNPQSEGLIPYINNPAPTTCMVFVASINRVDKRFAFFSELEKMGYLFYFRSLTRGQLLSWIKGEVKRSGKEITDMAVEVLLDVVGEDMMDIKGELGKLIIFVGDCRVIDVDDVEAVVADVKIDTIFNLTESIGRRDLKGALKALHKVMKGGEVPVRILGMVARQFRILWKVKAMSKKGIPRARMAQLAGVFPSYLDGYISQSKGFAEEELFKVFNILRKTDAAIKSGRQQGFILEKFVVDLCSHTSRWIQERDSQ
ncbi:MAG: DNA polymerase III subunit delta [Deltaproteobacteria bacterium]|nr:DNA polymerase III subunit delta [Deltaproteobacteria bacterium]